MLELKNVSFSAESENGEKEILKNISMLIDNGFISLTGPNGGGKSTLAKIIAGIITPTSGQIILDGEDITGLSVTERAKKGISFAFQQPVRFKGITVQDLIRLAAGREISITEACDYLSRVGLCARDYINREVNASLSGGELKRIEIATVLARKTKMYATLGGSIIIISHQERILNIADKVAVLSAGELVAFGPKDDILPELLTATKEACSVLTKNMEGAE